jgi:hypothetical protein
VSEITFKVERCEESGMLTASWDVPGGNGNGGITTQAHDLTELQEMVKEAVLCHFEEGKAPAAIRFHFIDDPVLATR